MLFTTLKHQYYKLTMLSPFTKKDYSSSLLTGETLAVLRQRIKAYQYKEISTSKDIIGKNLLIGQNLNQILKQNGRPTCIQSNRTSKIQHDVVLYKRIIKGIKSKVLYNLINNQIASVSFILQAHTPEELEKVNQFIISSYADEGFNDLQHLTCFVDRQGHKLIYENAFDVTLTFINNCPDVIQNINAALFQNNYSESKYSTPGRFELSF